MSLEQEMLRLHIDLGSMVKLLSEKRDPVCENKA